MLFWKGRTPGVLLGVVALALIAGCTVTPSAPTATPPSTTTSPTVGTSTPSATPTWNAEQTAAIDVVDRFFVVDGKIGADPSAYSERQMTELLAAVAGGAALKSATKWHLRLKDHGYHFTGQVVVLSTAATKPADDGRGVEIHVTRCQDQRQGKVVDKGGQTVSAAEFQIPAYNLRQYSVRKPPGENAFRVFGFVTINGSCP